MMDESSSALPALQDVPVGTELGSVEYVVDGESVLRHRLATHQPAYPIRDGVELAPVSFLAADGLRLTAATVDVSGLVDAGQRVEVIEPAIVGSRVTVEGKLVDVTERRGRVFLTIETVSRDDRGRLLAIGRTVVTRFETGS